MARRRLVRIFSMLMVVLAAGCSPGRGPAPGAGGGPTAAAPGTAPPPVSAPAPAPPPTSPETASRSTMAVEYLAAEGRWVEAGVWQEVTVPLTLRLSLPAGLDAGIVEDWVAQALYDIPYELTRPGPNVLVVTAEKPTHGLRIETEGLTTASGKRLQDMVWLFAIPAPPPQLVALDVTSGQELPLAELPPDIQHSSLSPDGRWVFLQVAPAKIATPLSSQDEAWMVETTTGRLTQLASLQTRDFPEVVWQREGVALFSPGWVQLWSYRDGSIQKSPSAAELWGNTSPDGRFELGWRLSGAGVAKGRLAPVSVVLHDLGTHTERSYADVVQGTVTWAGVPLRYAWEAGGEAVLLWDEATGQTVRLDLASGERRPSASLLPEAEPFPWRGPAGGWQYRSNGWGPVIVRSPGGGRESTFGRGLVLGWQGDHRLLVIRWANWDACKLTGSI